MHLLGLVWCWWLFRKGRQRNCYSEGNTKVELVWTTPLPHHQMFIIMSCQFIFCSFVVVVVAVDMKWRSLLRLSLNHRKLNTSPATLEDKDALKKFLTNPPVKKIDLHFPLGLEVTARNLKGVTVKDALDAIYKQFKKKVCKLKSRR